MAPKQTPRTGRAPTFAIFIAVALIVGVAGAVNHFFFSGERDLEIAARQAAQEAPAARPVEVATAQSASSSRKQETDGGSSVRESVAPVAAPRSAEPGRSSDASPSPAAVGYGAPVSASDAPPPMEAWQSEDIYQDTSAIAGRVISEAGEPIEGVTVVAEPLGQSAAGRGSADPVSRPLQARSGGDGFYAFPRLEDGTYRISADASPDYERASKVTRSGSHSVDLVLRAPLSFEVFGRVESETGEPLAGVRVFQTGRPAQTTQTDADGNYSLELAVTSSMSRSGVRFHLTGYRQESVLFSQQDWESRLGSAIDVKLHALKPSATVIGRVADLDGKAIAYARIDLMSSSAGRSFNAESDERGNFSFREVPPSDDYLLLVRTGGRYPDYRESGVKVPDKGMEMEIILEASGFGTVTGVVVDPAGEPLTGVGLSVRSNNAHKERRPIEIDQLGHFVVDDVPAGELYFEASGYPDLRAWGVKLAPTAQVDVKRVLDSGEQRIAGQVLDDLGAPVAGAQVFLTMEHQEGELRSRSTRKTTSDANGFFAFTGLGPGIHRVRVDASEYEAVSRDVHVRESVEQMTIRLQ